MPDLLPFAVIHIGVSVALAAILILVHRRLHRADFLVYWAMYWLTIAALLATSRVALPLVAARAELSTLATAMSVALLPFFPVFMICAGLSIDGGLSLRTARWLLAGSGVWAVAMGTNTWVRPPAPGTLLPFVAFRPLVLSLAMAFFAYRLASRGRREAGAMRPALVVLCLVYCLHNLFLGWSPAWLGRVYAPSGYSPWTAVIGILLQIGLTVVFTSSAIERASEASREAMESHRRLRSLLESVGIAGLMVDREGRVQFCNRWLTEALKLPPEAILGSPWFDSFVPATERRRVREIFDAGLDAGAWPAILEYPIQADGDRELVLRWFHTPLRDTAGNIVGMASLGLDLSQQRRMEEQIRQSQKMETLGQLAGGVAHDFNNNLTVINGLADLLLRKFSPADPVHQQIKDIRQSGEMAATLTRQLLAFSRKTKGEPQAVPLNQMVRNNEKMLRRLIREDIALEIETAGDAGYTRASPGQLDQILLNLAVNANDAIVGPGKIRIRTARVRGDDARGSGDFVALSVEDSGSGMSEHTRRHIFEPFFTTKTDGKGTGLGLAMVHGAVMQAGGWIDVESRLGKGSTFSVFLPCVEAPKAPEPVAPLPASSPAGGTVLLVEDQELVRHFASAVLEDRGYRVVEASNGAEALRLAAEPSFQISLLVTDVVMPEMSGDELAQRLERSHPGLRTLFVSGYSFDRDLRERSAGRAFLVKPYTPEALCEQVARLVNA